MYEKCNFPSLDEFDFLIILGGHMGAYEEETYSWLSLVKQFIKEAVNHNKYVLGICLGAQLIANALGGKVYPHTHKEVGWWPIEINKDASNVQILSGIADKFTALQFHGDTFDIPKAAVLLGSSKGCENQLFIYDDRVIGIQFHPELTNELIEKALKTYEYSKGFKGFMQKPEDIINQFTFLDQSTDMWFTLLDNIQNKFKENIENTPLC
ncbi:type 1 glutamine amidotransferase [Priestia aryabhattai]|uniref:type 1 glutamine amidotransferase n=1 Tax=Priestia aryabhattai TaxID=412384 RepID=UPI0039A32667